MRKFFTYILLLFAISGFAEHTTCTDYKLDTIHSAGGVISILKVDSCTWNITASPSADYKFAYWKNLFGTIDFDRSFVLEIDTNVQNYLYEANFVRDNAFIYKWLDDSIIIRTDTTDLLSSCDSAGWAYTVVNSYIRLADEDERITKLDWGVWKADVTELINYNNYAGLPLHMVINNACGKPSAVIDTIIPVVVHDTMYAHTMEFPNISHCDLQVLEDAVLYVDSDIVINGTLDIHEGGKVVINERHTLTAEGIILRGDGITKKWAQLLIKGEIINISEPLIYYDYTLNSSEYFPLSLPDIVSHNSIVSSITGLSTNYTSFRYDTELRNTHHTGWVTQESDYLLGQGYIVYSPVNRWKDSISYKQKTNIIRYPIRVTLANEKDNKSIHIVGETRDGIRPSDRNWNLISNPYICNYRIGLEDNFRYALWQDDELVQYITYSLDGYKTYEQEPINNFIMKPFNSYFVQVKNSENIEFRRDWFVTMGGSFLPKRNGISELRTGVTLTQDNQTEHIGLLYGNYTDEYEINADLAKMFGFASVMYAYSLSQNEQLAFQAVSIDSIYPIPVGYKNAKIEPMEFAFDNTRYTKYGLSALWLYDSKLNTHTNLLHEKYTFTPAATSEDNRFYITAELDVPTGIENTQIVNNDCIFDILGRKMNYIPNNGVYIIYKDGRYIKVLK